MGKKKKQAPVDKEALRARLNRHSVVKVKAAELVPEAPPAPAAAEQPEVIPEHTETSATGALAECTTGAPPELPGMSASHTADRSSTATVAAHGATTATS